MDSLDKRKWGGNRGMCDKKNKRGTKTMREKERHVKYNCCEMVSFHSGPSQCPEQDCEGG